MGRVFVVGSLNLDRAVTVSRHPAPGETVAGGDVRTLWGGKGANQAVAAARVASGKAVMAGPVYLIGRVGDDEGGLTYRRRLSEFGVVTSSVVVTPAVPTGSAIVIVNSEGENAIVVSPGANSTLTASDLEPLDDLGAGDVVVVSLEVPLSIVTAASQRAEAVGARFLLNLSPFGPVPEDVVMSADPLIVNEHEAAQVRADLGSHPSMLITRGAAGSDWNGLHVPSRRDVQVIDTTGAGDAYCGTLAAALAGGGDAEHAMRLATDAAAAAVSRVGAQ
ncbi:ribokinase [Microbacterium sp. JAI119]|uniref:ribokinase n=1 Tax=Microbacterium sp. JAI119 TaxID=2723062 RepID=UPI0015C89141|nr:ribokinase [Microbacterium sp. JAI119]NYF28073.1 ribokinase [Microbacterium sp. JAI119]